MAKPETIDQYKLNVNGIVIDVRILRDKDEIVPSYNISILNISLGTQIILNKLREEFISLVNVGNITVQERGVEGIKAVFEDEIKVLIKKYFPELVVVREQKQNEMQDLMFLRFLVVRHLLSFLLALYVTSYFFQSSCLL